MSKRTYNEIFAEMDKSDAERKAQAVPVTREELRTMAPAEIIAAKQQGRLADLLAGVTAEPASPPDGQLSRAELSQLSAAEIATAKAEGHLSWLLSGGADA